MRRETTHDSRLTIRSTSPVPNPSNPASFPRFPLELEGAVI